MMIIGSSNGRFMNFARHWYDKINAILQSIRLTPLLEDPCLYTGFIRDPSDPSLVITVAPLSLSLYVNNFVSFSKDPAVETLFCRLLAKRCKVDFMDIVEWFLGFSFFLAHHLFFSRCPSQPVWFCHKPCQDLYLPSPQ
jgi:hypothetical protein